MTQKERFKITPEVFLFLKKGEKVLLSRRFQTGYEDGNYGMIAGHAEAGEAMREATAREAFEEGGIIIQPEALRHVLTMHRACHDPRNKHERIGFYFTIDKWEGELHNAEPEKCDDLSWFSVDALPANTIPHIRKAIMCIQQGEQYSEFDFR